ncbi:MAG TPA: hypothetical protein VNX17_10250, partial [Edaphobacter sp.]|nr:hypothetical protein [Edaphobacter sp.]
SRPTLTPAPSAKQRIPLFRTCAWLCFGGPEFVRRHKLLISFILFLHKLFFGVFGPEIACQPHKTPNSFPSNNIHLAF